MISPSGNPTAMNRPTATASVGGRDISLSSLSVTYAVGSIARANIGMAIEDQFAVSSAEADTEVGVDAFGERIFAGYVDAPGMTLTGESLIGSSTLIHKARDLDESSLFSPGSHPASTEDFSITMAFLSGDASESKADAVLSRRDLKFDISGNIGRAVPDYVSSLMKHLTSSSSLRNLPANLKPAMTTIAEQSPKVIKALEEIEVDGGCSIPLSGLTTSLSDAASAFARNIAMGAMGTGKSPWSVMSALMSSFGLTILCLPNGKVMIAPDYSGCKPPGENEVSASSIARFSFSTSKSRPPSAVLAVAYGVFAGDYTNPATYAPVASYTPEKRPSSTSGVFTTGLPGWMIPTSRSKLSSPPPVMPEFLGESWAKQIYYQLSNVNRAMTVTLPFSPSVRAGTTYKIVPVSSVRFMSGGSIGGSKAYFGYCHSVTHSMSPDSSDISTTMVFRNIFEDTEEEAMIEGAPMFSDQKPFSV